MTSIVTIKDIFQVEFDFSFKKIKLNGIVKDMHGNLAYYVDGKFHREDGPAVICKSGSKIYYQNGKMHRLDGPALYCENETMIYYVEGKLDCRSGPAISRKDGSKEYWVDDEHLNISTDQELKDYLMLRMFE